jgi:Na+-driven multidrug efflux pump
MMVLAMVNKGTFIYLQALGKAGPSMILSLVREILFGVFLPILLPLLFGLDGVLYSFPTADVLTFILTVIVIAKVYRELGEGRIFWRGLQQLFLL